MGGCGAAAITFAVMPGNDDVVLYGMATMKELGVDIHPLALEKLRPRAVLVQIGMNNPSKGRLSRVCTFVYSSKILEYQLYSAFEYQEYDLKYSTQNLSTESTTSNTLLKI